MSADISTLIAMSVSSDVLNALGHSTEGIFFSGTKQIILRARRSVQEVLGISIRGPSRLVMPVSLPSSNAIKDDPANAVPKDEFPVTRSPSIEQRIRLAIVH
ncbi:hypothetical protein KC345_g6372 [Hortaea werneckii]|nr:hypothetical protein KC345_g6372 [Hortaea werneckii]